jgi:hypothetical protein
MPGSPCLTALLASLLFDQAPSATGVAIPVPQSDTGSPCLYGSLPPLLPAALSTFSQRRPATAAHLIWHPHTRTCHRLLRRRRRIRSHACPAFADCERRMPHSVIRIPRHGVRVLRSHPAAFSPGKWPFACWGAWDGTGAGTAARLPPC